MAGARRRVEQTAIYGAFFFRHVSNTTHCMEYQKFPFMCMAFVAWLVGQREGGEKGETTRIVETIF